MVMLMLYTILMRKSYELPIRRCINSRINYGINNIVKRIISIRKHNGINYKRPVVFGEIFGEIFGGPLNAQYVGARPDN